ncbi:MAG: glycerol dehydrogenase [Deltaproteobacteria bacterium]|nr:MAG: glycerol dehydrogenase [Deltaproteobacteria bacterium]
MAKILIAPNRYIQGPRVLSETGKYIGHLGSKVFFVGGPTALATVNDEVSASLKRHSIEYQFEPFSGVCSRAGAAKLSEKARTFGADVVAGVGGGRAIDTAKAVSHELGSALVIIPTVASNDAPCSALSVQHNENHTLDRFLILQRNPDVVLVDSKVIAEAPTRYFVAGMGDALATWFEAFTCTKSGAKNLPGGVTTAAALNLARLCYDTLMDYGVSARLAVDQNAVTPALERVIEANILLSGLGFESSGLAAAHGIHEGLLVLEGAEGALHGELVAFGTIAQLVMENYSREEIDRVLDFCNAVGLPVTLRQLGISDASPENLMKAAEVACMEGLTTHNSYFEINPELVLGAIIGANALGEASLKRSQESVEKSTP